MDLPKYDLKFDLTGRQVKAFWSVLYTHGYWAVAKGTSGSPQDLAARKVHDILGPLMGSVPGATAIVVELSIEDVVILDFVLRGELERAYRQELRDEVHAIREMLGEHLRRFAPIREEAL